ncbi:MAG: hypothetical protein QG622_3280 [Actinomycetota bacterium]|nr:hypothetical protein [Actinomycetota bacterium]
MNDVTPAPPVTPTARPARTAPGPGPGSPRALRVQKTLRVRKAGMLLVSTLAFPLGLTACGLVNSGGDDTQAPVVIPGEQVPGSESVTSDTSDVASLSSAAVTGSVAGSVAGSTAPPAAVSSVAAAPAPVTVTSTDVVVRRETRLRTVTKVPPAVTRTPPPVTQTTTQTQTETETQTQTQTQTLISVLPAKTLTRTATKTVTKTVTKK